MTRQGSRYCHVYRADLRSSANLLVRCTVQQRVDTQRRNTQVYHGIAYANAENKGEEERETVAPVWAMPYKLVLSPPPLPFIHRPFRLQPLGCLWVVCEPAARTAYQTPRVSPLLSATRAETFLRVLFVFFPSLVSPCTSRCWRVSRTTFSGCLYVYTYMYAVQPRFSAATSRARPPTLYIYGTFVLLCKECTGIVRRRILQAIFE